MSKRIRYLDGGLFEADARDHDDRELGYERAQMVESWQKSLWLDGVSPFPVTDDEKVKSHKKRDFGYDTDMTGREWTAIKRAWGSHGCKTNMENVVPSCAACNSAKGAYFLEEIMSEKRLARFYSSQEEHLAAARDLLNSRKAA